jgi:hypothetical protein
VLIKRDLAGEIARLKQQPGKNIGLAGSPTLVCSLLQSDLLDELSLMVHPVVVGRGKRLFADGDDLKRLRLVNTRMTRTGVATLTYRPLRAELQRGPSSARGRTQPIQRGRWWISGDAPWRRRPRHALADVWRGGNARRRQAGVGHRHHPRAVSGGRGGRPRGVSGALREPRLALGGGWPSLGAL